MTEAMFVALASAAVSLFGAAAGVLTALITSKHSATARLQEVSVNAVLEKRIAAYSSFLNACIEFEKDFENKDRLASLLSSLNVALVTSTEATCDLMLLYQGQLVALAFRTQETRDIKRRMIASMQNDLRTIQKPKIKRCW